MYLTKVLLVTLLPLFPTAFAALSDQCKAEGEALQNNTALAAVAPNANCDISQGQDSCTLDVSTLSGEFESVCLEQGGQFYEQDLVWDCSVSVNGETFNADFYFLNYPSCVGASCSITEIEEEFEQVAYPLLEFELAAQGFNCDVSAGSKPGGSAWALFSALSVMAAFVILM